MVCKKCEKQLAKEGATNNTTTTTTERGGLSMENDWPLYARKCWICRQHIHHDAKYCHTCAYSKGVCAMCGKQVPDTKFYKRSNV